MSNSETSVVTHLISLFNRDLSKLISELELYHDEKNMWLCKKAISNSAGNLTLHLVGNLNHFIGSLLGNTGYIRQRDLEFSKKNVPRAEIIALIEGTKMVVTESLRKLTAEDLNSEFRRNPFEDYMTTEYFLLHLLTHLSYHLGQINYHRRLIDA